MVTGQVGWGETGVRGCMSQKGVSPAQHQPRLLCGMAQSCPSPRRTRMSRTPNCPRSVSIPGHWPLVYTAGALARPSPAQPLAPLQSLPMRCCVWRAAKCLVGCQGPPQDQIRSRPLLSLPQRLCPAPRIAEHTGPPSSLFPLPVVVLSPQVHPGALQGPAVEGPLSTGDGAQSSQTDPWARSVHP